MQHQLNPVTPQESESVRSELDHLLMEKLPATNLLLAIIFFVYAVFDWKVLPAPIAGRAALNAGSTGFIVLCVSAVTHFRLLPPRWANPVTALVAFLSLQSAFLLMWNLRDGHLNVNLLLVLFVAAVFFTSRAWFLVPAAATAIGWTVFIWTAPASVSLHHSLALYNGVMISVVVNELTRRMLVRQEVLKLRSREYIINLKKASREAFEADALFRAVVRNTGDAVFVKDTEGRYLMVNDAFLGDFGRPKEVLLGRTATEIFGDEDGEPIAASERQVMQSGKSQTIEETLTVLGQTYLTTISPYLQQDDTIAGIIGISRNITQRKQAEMAQKELVRQLEIAKSQAEQAAKAKSEFLACMSHEIRTPMNGVLGMSELLLDSSLAPEQREYASAIHESAKALLHVINDILDFSKIEAGKMVVEPQPFKLEEMIQGVITLIQPSARIKGLGFCCELEPDLPEIVTGDSNRLRQILLNLLGNALKFTDSGKIALLGGVFGRGPGKATLWLSVEDTGVGIPPDKLQIIFEKFAQADGSTTRRFGGTGLGLAISQQLARIMGGDIYVESEVGSGSKFRLEVPVGIECGPKLKLNAQPSRVASQLQPTAMNILVAEDNLINQKVALAMLKSLGHSADVARDGIEAVHKAVRNSYDLILMDLEMPGLNGFQATNEIQRQMKENAPPIIALTAHAIAGYRELCSAAGMKGCLSKPVSKEELSHVFQDVLATTSP